MESLSNSLNHSQVVAMMETGGKWWCFDAMKWLDMEPGNIPWKRRKKYEPGFHVSFWGCRCLPSSVQSDF